MLKAAHLHHVLALFEWLRFNACKNEILHTFITQNTKFKIFNILRKISNTKTEFLVHQTIE